MYSVCRYFEDERTGAIPMTYATDNSVSSPHHPMQPGRARSELRSAASLLPGVALAAAIAVSAFLARSIPGVATFSQMILAILLGMAFHNIVGTPLAARAGIAFSLRRLLRVAIILLGFQLTLSQVASVGMGGLLVVAVTLIATFVFTVFAGRALGVDRKLTEMIAAGTSICGASAIVAVNTVTEAHDEDVAYAVACVTIFGSIAMFAYPVLSGVLHLDSYAYGLWSGASIHEIAQVVAAAFQNGQRAGEVGTMVKLARVMLLAPVVFTLNLKARFAASSTAVRSARPPVPWFVLGCQEDDRDADGLPSVRRACRHGPPDRYLQALRAGTPSRYTGRLGVRLYRKLFPAPHQTDRMIRS
jgi:uncharacterized integral membrane protein (TIGR00698 family)